MNNYRSDKEPINEEMGFLFNYKYGIKITMYRGVNTITSENFLSIPDFHYLKNYPLILFKINIHSYEKASLRSYDLFPLLIKIRQPKEELFIDRSGIYILNNIENLEIKILPTKNKIDFGSFLYHKSNNFNNHIFYESQSIYSEQIDINAKCVEIIDLTSEIDQIKQENYQDYVSFQKISQEAKETENCNSCISEENIIISGKIEIISQENNKDELPLNNAESTSSNHKNTLNCVQNSNEPLLKTEDIIFTEDYKLLIISKKIFDGQFLDFLKLEKSKLDNLNFKSTKRLSQRIIGKRGRHELLNDSKKLLNSYNKFEKNYKISLNEKKKNITEINHNNLFLNNYLLLNDRNNQEKINKDSISDSNTCMICIDNLTLPSQVTGCGHFFCKDCIDKWTAVSNSCPLCKKDYKKIIYYNQNKTKIIKQRNVKKKHFKVEEENEDSYIENTLEYCMKCKGTSDVYVMLVCDKCKFNVCHTYCAGLDRIPDEEWVCFECSKPNKNRSKRKRKKSVHKSNPVKFSKSKIKKESSPIKRRLRSRSRK
jgi:hypothetical protein